MKKVFALLALVISLGVFAQEKSKEDKSLWDNLPAPEGAINDYEHLFNPVQEEKLTELINAAALDAGVQIAIVTINPSQTPKERFEELTLHIAQVWGVGEKGKDNGILIGISAGYHRIRIQNGDGVIPLLSDKQTFDIIHAVCVPQFKENKYYEGTTDCIKEIVKIIKQNRPKK